MALLLCYKDLCGISNFSRDIWGT